jgi:hypothetical protein
MMLSELSVVITASLFTHSSCSVLGENPPSYPGEKCACSGLFDLDETIPRLIVVIASGFLFQAIVLT